MNLLFFHLDNDFGKSIKIVANNEVDLEQYLIKEGYTHISFSDIRESYGSCYLKDQYDSYTARCFYITKI